MKRRFYFILLLLAVILLAVPGFAAKAVKRITRSQATAVPVRLAWPR
jgi:hypothetical protein